MSEHVSMHRLDSEPSARPARIRALLVLLDLSPISDRILRRVAHLPLAEDASVTLLHVLPTDHPQPFDHDAERYARQALAEEARRLRQALPRTMRVEPVVKVGALLKEVAALARAGAAELIVMGRGEGRPLRDRFLGSTAERVIRQEKLPVLVVRLPAHGAYGRPALALDLDLTADDVVRVALQIVKPGHARVPVIHAFSPPYEGLAFPGLSEDALAQRRTACRRQAAGALAEMLAASLAAARVAAEVAPAWKLIVRHGPPLLVVSKLARRLQTDLLVLGTRAYTGVAHALLGTVAGELLREARCDVLVVPGAS